MTPLERAQDIRDEQRKMKIVLMFALVAVIAVVAVVVVHGTGGGGRATAAATTATSILDTPLCPAGLSTRLSIVETDLSLTRSTLAASSMPPVGAIQSDGNALATWITDPATDGTLVNELRPLHTALVSLLSGIEAGTVTGTSRTIEEVSGSLAAVRQNCPS